MKLDNKEFKRFRDLEKLIKSNKASEAEKAEYATLLAKKNDKGSNALEWWKNYPALLKDVTNIPFNWIPGTIIRVLNDSASYDELELGTLAVAHIAPTIGRSVDGSSAFNAQVRQLWLDLHRKYRGIGTYQQSDLGIALIAINSFFSTIAKFERIYGVINAYHVGNRVVPYGLKEALGISADLEANLADFRYTLNLFIEKARQLCLPKGLSVMESDIIALSNIFKDSNNKRACLFCFDTCVFGYYDPTTVSTGGCVRFLDITAYQNDVTPNGKPAYGLDDVRDILNMQLDALITDDDIARICSDLLAAYGQENVMTLVSVPEDYKVEPVHDYERQLQFHNLTIAGNINGRYEAAVISPTDAAAMYTADNTLYAIYQNNDVVKCTVGKGNDNWALVGGSTEPTYPASMSVEQGKGGDTLFDTWVENPGETEVMCGTRFVTLVNTPVVVSTNVWRQEYVSFGTQIVTDVEMFAYRAGGTYVRYTFSGTVVNESTFDSRKWEFMKLMQMDWHPIFFISDSGDFEMFGDIDNPAVISRANLDRIHDVALLSGYKIPMVSIGSKD